MSAAVAHATNVLAAASSKSYGTSSDEYLTMQCRAIDAAVQSSLPNELLQLIASYIPPDFMLRWTAFLEPALGRLPIVTAPAGDAGTRIRFALSYQLKAPLALGERFPAESELNAGFGPIELDSVMKHLTKHVLERKVVRSDAKNEAFLRTTDSGGADAITAQLNLIRAEFDALIRDAKGRLQKRIFFGNQFSIRMIDPGAAVAARAASFSIRIDQSRVDDAN